MITTDLVEIEYLQDGPVDGTAGRAGPWLPRRRPHLGPGGRPAAGRICGWCGRTCAAADGAASATEAARGAQVAALGSDLLALLDGLGIERCLLVGHDWGSRAVHAAATLAPERVSALVAMSTAYGPLPHLTADERLADAYAAWYRYWLCTEVGRTALPGRPGRADPPRLGRVVTGSRR